MAGWVLALVALVAWTAVYAEASCGGGGGGGGRVSANSLRIHDLQEQLAALQERIESRKRLGEEKIKELGHLQDRVDTMQGNVCHNENQFACGRYSSECISFLMACDGYQDCKNGEDETEENCFDIAHAGQVLEGELHGEHCDPHKNPTHIRVAVTGETRSHWFPSVEDITAHVTIDYADDSHAQYDLKGKYYFGNHKLIIYHGEGHQAIDLVCKFAHGRDDHCYAEFVREDDGSVCGRATLFTKDH